MNDIERAIALLREERGNDASDSAPVGPDLELDGLNPGRLPSSKHPDPLSSGKRFDESTFEKLLDESPLTEISSRSASETRQAPGGHGQVAMPENVVASTSRTASSRAASPAKVDGTDQPSRHRLPRIVDLPLKALSEQGILTPDQPKGRLSEEFRRVKRPILKNLGNEVGAAAYSNFVMVTSSVAGEGKTFTAINLAMSLAMERERTVLLIDADVFKGTAGKRLGIPDDCPGLTDLLADPDIDVADIILPTNVADLRLIPAGTRSDQTTELLSSQRMVDLVGELARRYSDRIIILDCPPMLQTNEANVIADYAGQIVFVVAGQETDQRLVLEAMKRFDPEQSVGILLNKAARSGANYGYDYGYE